MPNIYALALMVSKDMILKDSLYAGQNWAKS
jgi:hypothetical protein